MASDSVGAVLEASSVHLLVGASAGFVLALVLLAFTPSLVALLFTRKSAPRSSPSASRPKHFVATDAKAPCQPPHVEEEQDAEDDEKCEEVGQGKGKAKESKDGHQPQKEKDAPVAPMRDDEEVSGKEPGTNDATSLSSSPSFPRLRRVEASTASASPSSTLRRAVVPASSTSPEHARVAASLPSPAPSVYSFLSSSSGTGTATSSSSSSGGDPLASSLSCASSTSSLSVPSQPSPSPPSPPLGSSVSFPPHSAPESGAPTSASTASSLAVHAAPSARLLKRQTAFLESVKLGQSRDAEATSCLPNPAVHQWWEMERLLEKEYTTIEEKAFGVMMKLMPFRSGEGLKDPPKIVPNPYHGNRVILTPLEGALPEHDTTFYNASYIKEGQFIAASMPHNDLTRQDFWRMIYEQDSRLIVMLNLEDESHGDPYWPNELNSTTNYGPMAITKTEQMRMRFYESTVRKFTISRTDKPDAPSKQVLHVHNTVWPDKGIPENVEAFTDMVEYVKQEYEQLCENKTGPMTVHCFGGIGRTGSFLTCMISLLSIRETQEANVFSTVLNLRTDRAMMVQTQEQYKFCYRVVMELLSRSKRKALHRGLSGVLRRSAKPKPTAGLGDPAPIAILEQALESVKPIL